MPHPALPLAIVALALVSGAARAGEAAPAAPQIKLVRPAAFGPEAALPRGLAKTSVASRLDARGVVGELGFLCGRQASEGGRTGAAAARGYDPNGRFVGAKLKLTF
jgi:hypothetical protein